MNTPQNENEFDDPALRAAIRRTCRAPVAPPALRERVEALLSAGGATGLTIDRPGRRGGSRWAQWVGASLLKTAAAAAVCFIAIGLASVQIWATFRPEPRPIPTSRVSFPTSLTADLIRTHDMCAKRGDHRLVPGDNAAASLVQLAHLRTTPPP